MPRSVKGTRGYSGPLYEPADWVKVERVVGGGDCALNMNERTEVVYKLLRYGHNCIEIAQLTRMSDRTVRRHKNLLKKEGRL